MTQAKIHPTMSDDTLRRLENLRNKLKETLLKNSDYRALLVVEWAVRELSSGTETAKHSSPHPPQKLSQTEAATQVLREKGKPLTLEELMELLKAKGITFRAKRPHFSLSASLSSHKHFRSIRYSGTRCWWFSDRPIPASTASKRRGQSSSSHYFPAQH
jgi:hypothetical protein